MEEVTNDSQTQKSLSLYDWTTDADRFIKILRTDEMPKLVFKSEDQAEELLQKLSRI